MSFTNSEGIRLWDKAKEIEQSLPQKRQLVYEYILKLDPSIKYKNFGGLQTGLKHNKLPAEIAKVFQESVDEIEALKNQAKYYREESDRLIQEKLKNDTRKKLDPKIDSIPPGEYPKLADCSIYPLRHSCNFGENENSKWERCEYMKYDNAKGIFDSSRWECTYNEDSK